MRAHPFQIFIITFCLAARAAAQESASFHPQPVALPLNATYVLADGSVYIVAGEDARAMLTKFNELFVKTHPGFKFKLLLKGSSATAPSGLTTGVSAFAVMDREMWPLEVRPFRQTYGYAPTDIRIGHNGYFAPDQTRPPGIYVNARNPLAGLTLEQVSHIFTTGGGSGDITRWNQLGLQGDWTERVIHIYGPRDDGGFASAIRDQLMGGFPFARRYEPLPSYEEIIKAVAEDPYGIALVGFFEAKLTPAVRMLPIALKENAPYSTASYRDVMKGLYPFSTFLHLYVNRAPGKSLDLFVKEYARMVLSREGQAIIAAEKSRGYVPLSAWEAAEELKKLE